MTIDIAGVIVNYRRQQRAATRNTPAATTTQPIGATPEPGVASEQRSPSRHRASHQRHAFNCRWGAVCLGHHARLSSPRWCHRRLPHPHLPTALSKR